MDKAEALTPLMRLRRKRRAFRIFGALLILVIIVLVGTVLAVNQGRNYNRLVHRLGLNSYLLMQQPAQAEAPLRYRRVSRVAAVPPRLMTPNVGQADRLRSIPSQEAHERCLELASGGTAQPSFQSSGNEWECLLSQEIGSAAEPSVIFIQARGTSPDSFRTFRAKLSLLDPNEDQAVIRRTLDAIERFGLALSPESGRYVEERITGGRDFSSLLENYRIIFERERGEGKRFNLLIVPRTSATICGPPGGGKDGAPLRSTTIATPVGCLGFQHRAVSR